MNQVENKPRLSRDTWLQQALDILSEDPEHVRIDELAERLGVSKGSFYWHFENRSQFISAMAEYWRDRDTANVAAAIARIHGSAEDRLHTLMRHILEDKLGQYDLAVRAWARHEPSIKPIVREVDNIRLKASNELFLEMGFDEAEARMRARVFVICHSLEGAMSVRMSRKEALKQLSRIHTDRDRDRVPCLGRRL
jgi:AcrR family transcriptional regulator